MLRFLSLLFLCLMPAISFAQGVVPPDLEADCIAAPPNVATPHIYGYVKTVSHPNKDGLQITTSCTAWFAFNYRTLADVGKFRSYDSPLWLRVEKRTVTAANPTDYIWEAVWTKKVTQRDTAEILNNGKFFYWSDPVDIYTGRNPGFSTEFRGAIYTFLPTTTYSAPAQAIAAIPVVNTESKVMRAAPKVFGDDPVLPIPGTSIPNIPNWRDIVYDPVYPSGNELMFSQHFHSWIQRHPGAPESFVPYGEDTLPWSQSEGSIFQMDINNKYPLSSSGIDFEGPDFQLNNDYTPIGEWLLDYDQDFLQSVKKKSIRAGGVPPAPIIKRVRLHPTELDNFYIDYMYVDRTPKVLSQSLTFTLNAQGVSSCTWGINPPDTSWNRSRELRPPFTN